MKYAVMSLVLTALLGLGLVGCGSSTTPADPAKISVAIKVGTSAATSIGFVAIPDPVEAIEVATLTRKVLDENILPLLNGDETALIAGLEAILELKAFDDPKLAKAKLILEAGLSILESYLPPDILDAPLSKIPPDVKLYLLAFFEGARDGADNYLGNKVPKGLKTKGFANYGELRAKLKAK